MRYYLLSALLFITLSSYSQDEPVHPSQQQQQEPEQQEETTAENEKEKPDIPLSERMFFGGSFGMSFGDYTYINLSPLVGYKLTPSLSVGAGVIYQYSKIKYYDYSSNMFGGRLMGIAKVYGPLFAQIEYEYLNYDSFGYYSGEELRRNYNSVFAGGGLAQPISKNMYFTAIALYNLTYSINSYYTLPYDSPWVFRVGVSAGF